jgi:glycerophosphoryl diester phosphodiesterase
MTTLKPYLPKIMSRLIIQCADLEPLRILHRNYPDIQVALLPIKKGLPIGDWIKELRFKPDFFLPRYSYVTPGLLNSCHSLQIKVIPWMPDDPKNG